MYMCDTSHPNVETGSERLVIWGFAANICAWYIYNVFKK
jgi:hypothetical protein